jgi:flagellar motor switch protein FliG
MDGIGYSDRPPLEKAAIVLQMLGEDAAAKVLKNLPMSDVIRMTQAIIHMKPPSAEEAEEVSKEFMDLFKGAEGLLIGGEEFAKVTINKAFDKITATRLLDTLSSPDEASTFEAISKMEPRVIAEFIRNEHPQTIALIIAHLETEMSGKVLAMLPAEIRSEIMLRVSRFSGVSPMILEEVTEVLKTDLLNLGTEGRGIGGLKRVAEILNHTEKGVEEEIMGAIKKEDASMAESIQQLMFVFDDLESVDDRAIQEILKEIDTNLLARALRGASETIRDKFYKNMSRRAAQILEEEIEVLGPTRLSEVEGSQLEIVRVALRLRDEGRIQIEAGGEGNVLI